MSLLCRFNMSVLVCLLLSGCAAHLMDNPEPGDPDFAPVPAQALQPPPSIQGGLFQANYGMSLFNDRRAHRIGDIITVILEERTVSRKSTETSTQKDSSMEVDEPTILGLGNIGFETDYDFSRSFTGGGDSDRSNSLQGSITVTVSDVLPNGNLRIRGEKWMTLNEGNEFIRLTGLVRPSDIGPNNTVQSNKIADARIAFSGTGAIANANKQGWFDYLVNSRWWPF